MGAPGRPDPTQGLEHEVKLDVPSGVPLPPLDDVGGIAEVVELAPQDLDATYWDAEGLPLLAAGATLRRRVGAGGTARWTLKLPAPSAPTAGDALARTEVELDDAADEPPHELLERARPLLDGRPVAAVARLRSRRRRAALLDAAGARLAELADDEVTAEVPGRAAAAFREVEVELGPAGSADLLAAVAARLRGGGARAADPRPKLARALGADPAGEG